MDSGRTKFHDFMARSVSNFTAVETIKEFLDEEGFSELREADAPWQVQPGARHYIVKNHSAIFAFIAGDDPANAPFTIIAAHSDSPGFRLKPHPEITVDSLSTPRQALVKLNTEVYGGAIYSSWMDRPLGLSGRVIVRDIDGHIASRIVRLDSPRIIIPRLAIHFNRQVNQGQPLSAQKDMLPVMGYINRSLQQQGGIPAILAEACSCTEADILDYDLTLFDIQGPEVCGFDGTWTNCGRLDDLAMAWCALQALLEAGGGENTRVMAIFDNEETGSGTRQGAHSPVLRNILRRVAIEASDEQFLALTARSFFISADCAHAAHPNYLEKMDSTNLPRLGGGPVIKINANCKYMTDALTAARFKQICNTAGVPWQEFVNHSDSPGGSTLGNILTAHLDIDGVDMGLPLLAMHSCRETVSYTDIAHTIAAFTEAYNTI